MKSIKIILALLILISSACEKEVKNIKLPEFEQKLVISAFLCPGNTITNIYVTSNRRLYGELTDNEPRGIMKGTISNGTNEVELDTCITGFTLDHQKMKIEYGKTYTIRLTSDLGMSAEATCSVPAKKSFSIEIDTTSTARGPSKEYNVKISFNDIPGESNFYRMKAYEKSYFNSSYGYHSDSYQFEIDDPLFNDNRIDGSKISRAVKTWPVDRSRDSVFVLVKLYHTEESYFRYHKTLSVYNGGDNPFAEATPVFSNITGGLGIFTSYTIDSAIIRLK